MTDPPTDSHEPHEETTAPPAATAGTLTYQDLLAALGFDPSTVQTVVITASSAVAISDDYPEPYTTTEATHGE